MIGIILSIILIKYIFRVSFDKENEQLNSEDSSHTNEAKPISLIVKNPAIFNKTVAELSNLLEHRDFVISRVWRDSNKQIEIASANTVLQETTRFLLSRLRRMPRRSRPLSEKRSIWNVNSGSVWKANLSIAVS